jgi:hypothetical protein
VLKPPRQVHEGLDVATACQAHQMFVIHCHTLASKGARKRVRPLSETVIFCSQIDHSRRCTIRHMAAQARQRLSSVPLAPIGSPQSEILL